MADFVKFQNIVAESVSKAFGMKERAFRSNVSGYLLADHYVDAFPEGTNPIFRERTEHDCNCCKRFIRDVGNTVWFLPNGKLRTIWDEAAETAEYPYNVVAASVRQMVVSNAKVEGAEPFYHYCHNVGDAVTKEVTSDSVIAWDHFHGKITPRYVVRMDQLSQEKEKVRAQIQIATRSLTELGMGPLETVMDLINGDQLPRGPEYKDRVKTLIRKKKQLEGSCVFTTVSNMAFTELVNVSLRNTLIGSLLVDLSEGRDLEQAVRAYDKNAAPENFKRSSSVVTPRMKDEAKKRIKQLGIEASLPRRMAVASDLSVNDVLFVDASIKPLQDSVLDILDSAVPNTVDPKSLKPVDVTAYDFFKEVVPKSSTMEVLVEGRHKPNLMTMIAPVHNDAKNILKWDNNFSWAFNGDITDASMAKRVESKGGRTDGVLRFTHEWNHDGKNQSLMDLHVFIPGSKHSKVNGSKNDSYPSGPRVGWNNRKDVKTGGVQDVDYTSEPGPNFVPIENITFPDIYKMPDGVYGMWIHNWRKRNPSKSGFKCEIAFQGQTYQYDYDKETMDKEWIHIADVTLSSGVFTIDHKLQLSSAKSEEVWGIKTQEFVPVHLITTSPNSWGGKTAGNPLHFFILKDCKRSDSCRGLYTEFLMQELQQDRKVFEVLGSLLLADYSDEQLSGLGFNQTTRNELVCKTVLQDGSTKLYNIKF